MRKWIIILGVVLVLFLITIYGLGPRIHTMIRNRTERILQTQFESKVEFSDFHVSLFPRLHATITKLVMRHKGRTDVPPLIQVREVSIYGNLLSLLRTRQWISLVRLDGLQIPTPPRQPGGEPLIQRTDQDLAKKYPLLIDEINADDAIIVVLRAQTEKPPHKFPLHDLALRDISFDRPAPFRAILTNAVPPCEIDSAGEFGPWQPDAPSETEHTHHQSSKKT